MKLVVLRLDGDVAQIKFCENPNEWVKNFSNFATKIHFDETRNSAKIEVFNTSLVDTIEFKATKLLSGRNITRFVK